MLTLVRSPIASPIRSPIMSVVAGQGGNPPTPPVDNADAQLVWDQPAKSGFVYWIRMF